MRQVAERLGVAGDVGEVAGGHYRMVVAFDFRRSIAFIKFVGTHAEYDRIDALTVKRF